MKRCHYCGKPASIFLTQIANGKLSDFALCKACAKERGIFDPRKLCMAGNLFPSEISGEVESFIRKMLESSFMEEAEEAALASLPDMLTECPSCHYTLERYQQSGLLGCPECYKAFSTELMALVDDAETPARATSIEPELLDTPALERGRLEVLMHDAIKNENYEEAARLRDRIKSLSEST